MLRLTLLMAAAILALAGAAAMLLLPPAALPAVDSTSDLLWPVARGAFHVHSSRSDGTGTIDEIAAAAARAGLQFVILTDHGDGTRAPDPPAYRSGVLCLDGVEISTQHGHYAAVGVAQAPYPLGGHPRAVIEDVHRLGGFGFAAHPGSPKAALKWDAWDAPFDGIEWLNADSEWRDEFWTSLGRVLLTYPFRPAETLVGLLDRPEPVLQQWDRLTAVRRVAGIAGADAHARLGYRQASDPYNDRILARAPSYEMSFRAFANHVVLDGGLTGDAAADAAQITSAIRNGRMFTSIDGLARLGAFEARGTSGVGLARVGEYLDAVNPVAIEAHIAAPAGTTMAVLRDGEVVYETQSGNLRVDVGTAPGAYRVEAYLPGQGGRSRVPWVLTNPIYVGLQRAHESARATDEMAPVVERTAIDTAAWRPEASEGSTSALSSIRFDDGTPALEWDFALAGGSRGSQYAAMRFPTENGLAAQTRLIMRARSSRPRRVWAQLRTPGARGVGERWGYSFYIGESLDTIELRFEDFRPLGAVSSEHPPLDRIDSILLVIDTVNSAPGSAGRIAMTDLWLAR